MPSVDAPEPGKYGVQAGSLSAVIYAGRLNKDKTAFADKEVVTDMTLAAVGNYVWDHYDGGMIAEFPGLGFAVEVIVTPLAEGDGG